jgi:hypothetical protein
MENLDDIFKTLNIDMNYTSIDEQTLSETSYVIIRHGYSDFNYKEQEIVAKYGEASDEVIAIKGDKSMYDPGLHAIGVR